jgi:uncharacterized protein involved in outer membrane biogenesis
MSSRIKKVAAIILIFFALIYGLTSYLNRVLLPKRIKALVVNSLEEATQKKVTLESLQFNLFKGMVLRGLEISDADKQLIVLKEGSCTFLIWPVFQKKIIIPYLRLKGLEVFLERRQD